MVSLELLKIFLKFSFCFFLYFTNIPALILCYLCNQKVADPYYSVNLYRMALQRRLNVKNLTQSLDTGGET